MRLDPGGLGGAIMKNFNKVRISLLGLLVLFVGFSFLTLQAEAAVRLSKSKVSMVVGASYNLKLEGTKKTAKWKSSQTKVASVNSKGVVKAKKKGTAKITATIGKKNYTCTVTVKEKKTYAIKIKTGDRTLSGKLEDNSATRELIKLFPMKVEMENLFDREMCYQLKKALPTQTLREDSYKVGDIIYWPPERSFVILYKQNGEKFERQQLGTIQKKTKKERAKRRQTN
ncbi:MAG: Ig-like domain-containing protein [Lachnospiraceae bacterium]|nr:Ig-like domain-containing protein [Lachnospiraceae bacterium]